MGENLIARATPGPRFSPAASLNAVPVIEAAAPVAIAQLLAHGSHHDYQQQLDVLRNMVEPGAISGWVQRYAGQDGWQQILLDKVLEACRAVPIVPDGMTDDEPNGASSLELVAKCLIACIGEACAEIGSSRAATAEALSLIHI